MKKINKRFLMMLMAAVLMFYVVSAVSATATNISTEKIDVKDIKIQSKAKTVSSRITWNGNSGKIGAQKTKVTTVKNGAKIEKLPPTPKRSGYTFEGWYTKKTGGTKISKNTKPIKSVNYYAH